jgi:hypothetical protein
MEDEVDVCPRRREAAGQIGLRLDGVAIRPAFGHLSLILEYYAQHQNLVLKVLTNPR